VEVQHAYMIQAWRVIQSNKLSGPSNLDSLLSGVLGILKMVYCSLLQVFHLGHWSNDSPNIALALNM